MGMFDNLLNSALPGGSMAKPIGIALMGLLAAHAMGGRGQGAGSMPYQPTGESGYFPQRPEDIAPEQQHDFLSGGLSGLVQRFQQGGLGDVVNSWIGTGQNQPIAPNQLQQALGRDTIDNLSRQTGMPQQDLLSQLSQMLPQFVDRLTPQGRIPDRAEMMRG